MANSKPDLERIKLLVEAAQKGDQDALGEIYQVYRPQVYRYIRLRVGRHEVAEDLTSETFARVCRGIVSFQWNSPGGWIITIAGNLVRDHFKSSHTRLEISTAEMLDVSPSEYMPNPESVFARAARLEDLIDTIQYLTPEQRRCVELRFFNGLSVRDTAQLMDKSEGAVKSLTGRAIQNLRSSLPAEIQYLE